MEMASSARQLEAASFGLPHFFKCLLDEIAHETTPEIRIRLIAALAHDESVEFAPSLLQIDLGYIRRGIHIESSKVTLRERQRDGTFAGTCLGELLTSVVIGTVALVMTTMA